VKLIPLFEGEYVYSGSLEVVVSPHDEEKKLQLYGGGDGRVEGERITGTVEWLNAPTFRKDGVLVPNVRGLIRTEDGARVRYETQGYSYPVPDRPPNLRSIVASVRFYSKAKNYQWVNTLVGMEEGIIDVATGRIKTKMHQCENTFELPEAP
jgi:hypothetical protein